MSHISLRHRPSPCRNGPFCSFYSQLAWNVCGNWICCTSHGYVVHPALLEYTTRRHVSYERNPQPHRCENSRTVSVTCSERHIDHVICIVQRLSVSCEACFWWLCNDAGIFSRRFVLQYLCVARRKKKAAANRDFINKLWNRDNFCLGHTTCLLLNKFSLFTINCYICRLLYQNYHQAKPL